MDKALEILNHSELHKIPNEIPNSKETDESFSYIVSISLMVAMAFVFIKTISDANERRHPKTSD